MTCKDCLYQCDWVTEPYETCERFKNKDFYGDTNNKNTGDSQK